MAEFCTKCSEKLFGESGKPDIDVQKEFDSLQPGWFSSGFLCEGCGLVVITKTEEGELKVARIKENESGEMIQSELESY